MVAYRRVGQYKGNAMRIAARAPRVLLDEFERCHADRMSCKQVAPTAFELLITLLVTTTVAPFAFVTFFVIPMMGQITVGLSCALMLTYLRVRSSLLVVGAVVLGIAVFWGALFASIQVIKSNLEVPLFFFTATGIPVCAVFCIFVATRIWTIRGGID